MFLWLSRIYGPSRSQWTSIQRERDGGLRDLVPGVFLNTFIASHKSFSSSNDSLPREREGVRLVSDAQMGTTAMGIGGEGRGAEHVCLITDCTFKCRGLMGNCSETPDCTLKFPEEPPVDEGQRVWVQEEGGSSSLEAS